MPTRKRRIVPCLTYFILQLCPSDLGILILASTIRNIYVSRTTYISAIRCLRCSEKEYFEQLYTEKSKHERILIE